MLEAVDWSVVVVGRWNRSILTPAGIGSRLFKIPEGTPLEVELAIDVMLPPRVTYENLRVSVGSQRLIIESLGCNFTEIERARELARNAMESLPETPITAVGINVKYAYKEADEYLTRVLEMMSTELDDRLSALSDKVTKRSLSRSMLVGGGRLNLTLLEDEQCQLRVELNYEHVSEDISKQNEWLRWPIEGCKQHVRTTLSETLEFPEDVIPDD
jgi:uncharacterized protein YjfI (DUF2170 family)